MRFDNHYCWVVRFDGETIIEVRAYLDSALVAELFRQNPIRTQDSEAGLMGRPCDPVSGLRSNANG